MVFFLDIFLGYDCFGIDISRSCGLPLTSVAVASVPSACRRFFILVLKEI